MFQRIVKLDIMFKRGDNDDDKNEQTKNPLVTNQNGKTGGSLQRNQTSGNTHRSSLKIRTNKRGYNKDTCLSEESRSCLDEDWIDLEIAKPNFDILKIVNVAELYDMVSRMFRDCSDVHISDVKFNLWIRKVAELYSHRHNPYHNFKHGVTVMQSLYYFLQHTEAQKCFNGVNKFAMLFSGICHDIDHTGRSNVFEINSRSHLALRYNDTSVLENHHCAIAFEILNDPKMNITENISVEDTVNFRKLVIVAILATDVKSHFDILDRFRVKLDHNELNPDQGKTFIWFLLKIIQNLMRMILCR